jgi:hypothetical protein
MGIGMIEDARDRRQGVIGRVALGALGQHQSSKEITAVRKKCGRHYATQREQTL